MLFKEFNAIHTGGEDHQILSIILWLMKFLINILESNLIPQTINELSIEWKHPIQTFVQSILFFDITLGFLL